MNVFSKFTTAHPIIPHINHIVAQEEKSKDCQSHLEKSSGPTDQETDIGIRRTVAQERMFDYFTIQSKPQSILTLTTMVL